MSGKLSRRGGAVDPFIVMDVMAAAAEKEAAGDTVIHLEVGQPSTPAPKAALAAAHAALDTDRIGYVAALGMPASTSASMPTADIIWPGVQYPHWRASCSANAACKG